MATENPKAGDSEPVSPAIREGEPFPSGAIDPELVSLPRRRPQVGPLVSLSVIAISLLLLVKIAPDLRFVLEGEATEYASIGGLLADGDRDDFVTVRATPDLLEGAVVRKSKGSYGHRLQPVLGSAGKLWLMTHHFHWHADLAHDLRYTGRLSELDELPAFEELVEHWQSKPDSRRTTTAASLRETLLDDKPTLAVTGGDQVAWTPDTAVEIAEIAPGSAMVTTYYTEEHPDARSWLLVLEQAGLDVDGGRSLGQGASGETFLFKINHPGGAPAIADVFAEKRLFAAQVEPEVIVHRALAGDLGGDAAGAVLDGERIEWGAIDRIHVAAAYPLDTEARVIITTDRPEDYSHVLFIAPLLAAVIALFGYILARQGLQLVSDLRTS